MGYQTSGGFTGFGGGSPFGSGSYHYTPPSSGVDTPSTGFNEAAGFGNPAGAAETPYYDPYFGNQQAPATENPPPVDPPATGDGSGDNPYNNGGFGDKAAAFQSFLDTYLANYASRFGGGTGGSSGASPYGYNPYSSEAESYYGSASNPDGVPVDPTDQDYSGGTSEIDYGLPGTDGPSYQPPAEPTQQTGWVWTRGGPPLARGYSGSRNELKFGGSGQDGHWRYVAP